MAKTIGLISIKGGVGKTTISAALGSNLANRHGAKVLLVDANYSAPNLGIHMNIISPEKTIHDVLKDGKIRDAIHSKYGVDVIPGNFLFNKNVNPLELKTRLARVKKDYDFIILDASPSLNDEVLSTILASDALFVVTTPDYPTLSCSMKAAKLARQRGRPVAGIIMNKSRGEYEVSLEEIQASTGIPVISKINEDDIVHMALHARVPAPMFARESHFVREINKISNALIGKREKRSIIDRLFFHDYKQEQVNREILRRKFTNGHF